MPPEADLVCLDDAEVVIRCEDYQSVEVRFAERHAVDERLVFSVRLRAPGLDARLDGITNAAEGRGLARFLDGLDFRGWQGELIWTNADDDLAVSAIFESRGHIALTWTIRPWRHSAHGTAPPFSGTRQWTWPLNWRPHVTRSAGDLPGLLCPGEGGVPGSVELVEVLSALWRSDVRPLT